MPAYPAHPAGPRALGFDRAFDLDAVRAAFAAHLTGPRGRDLSVADAVPPAFDRAIRAAGLRLVHCGAHRLVAAYGTRWVVKAPRGPAYARANTSELETWAALPPALAAHFAPVADAGGGLVLSPYARRMRPEEYAAAFEAVEAVALAANVPDVSIDNCGVLGAGAAARWVFIDYGYCLHERWTPDQWPQGAASAPADVRAFWAALEAEARQ